MYLAHESQIREPGDYFSTRIGRQPVFVVRKRDGGIAAFINACAHRGAVGVVSRVYFRELESRGTAALGLDGARAHVD